jgi:hypothetical protein
VLPNLPQSSKYIRIPEWLLCHNEVSQTAKLLYGVFLKKSFKNNLAYPKISEVAEILNKCERTIYRLTQELVLHRLIEVRRRGRKKSNVYTILAHEWAEESDRTLVSGNDESDRTLVSHKEASDRTLVSDPPCTKTIILHNNTKLEEEGVDNAEFESFWEACPKKIKKLQTQKAYEQARRIASAETLLSKMKAYSNKVFGENIEERFHCSPENWLMNQRWFDHYGKYEPKTLSCSSSVPDQFVWKEILKGGVKYMTRVPVEIAENQRYAA